MAVRKKATLGVRMSWRIPSTVSVVYSRDRLSGAPLDDPDDLAKGKALHTCRLLAKWIREGQMPEMHNYWIGIIAKHRKNRVAV